MSLSVHHNDRWAFPALERHSPAPQITVFPPEDVIPALKLSETSDEPHHRIKVSSFSIITTPPALYPSVPAQGSDDDCADVMTLHSSTDSFYFHGQATFLAGGEQGQSQDRREGYLQGDILIPASPIINRERDWEIVSQFVADEDADEARPKNSSSYSLATSIASRHGVPLQRTSTIETLVSTLAHLTPLSRTSSLSEWHNALERYGPHFDYTLEEWGKKIRESPSLRSSKIIRVDRYYQKGGFRHRFLVFQLQRKSQSIFLRLERGIQAGINVIKLAFSSGVTPNDRAYLAADEMRVIRGNTPMSVKIRHETRILFSDPLRSPTLSHLEHILSAIGLQMNEYRLSRENCWLFSSVILERLFDTFKGTLDMGKLDHTGLPAAPELRASIYAQLPSPLLLRTISVESRHGPVVAVHPQGRHIASSSNDFNIQLWDAATGTAIGKPLLGHTNWTRSIVFSPDGKCIASGSDDQTVRIWDFATGAPIGEPLKGIGGVVNSIAFSPNGRYIACGTWKGVVQLWDIQTGTMFAQSIHGHTDEANSVVFSPDGRFIYSASDDKTIRIWDAETCAAVGKPFRGHIDRVRVIAVSPDGRCIASASDDHTIRRWDAKTNAPIGDALVGHTSWIEAVTFSPNGKYIVSGSGDKTIRIWDAATGAAIGEPFRGHTGRVWSIAFSPDGERIISGSWDKTIRIWDARI